MTEREEQTAKRLLAYSRATRELHTKFRDIRESTTTQTGLAKASGITRQQIAEYESGEIMPSVKAMNRLLEPMGYELAIREKERKENRLSTETHLREEYGPLTKKRSEASWIAEPGMQYHVYGRTESEETAGEENPAGSTPAGEMRADGELERGKTFTMAELSRRMHVSRQTVYNWRDAGLIHPTDRSGRLCVSEEELWSLLRKLITRYLTDDGRKTE